jgi:integrase/recombinase XerD
LQRDHIDWEEGVITIWNSKFQKSRAIPLHPTSLRALRRYTRIRDKFCPHPASAAFFVSTTGSGLTQGYFHKVFSSLVRQAGVDRAGQRRPARMICAIASPWSR